MPTKWRRVWCRRDDLIWEQLETKSDAWCDSVHKADVQRAVGAFIVKCKPGKGVVLYILEKGGYNVSYRLEYDDGTSVVMRIPIKDFFPSFADEKVRYEVATMKYVAANTTLPVPHVYTWGTAAENPLGLGPFIIMDYIEHHRRMSFAMRDEAKIVTSTLDRSIAPERLEFLLAQMADIVLQLSSLSFPRIGSLVEAEDGTIDVGGRPIITSMIDLEIHTDAPESILPRPETTYGSAHDWFAALADIHMMQTAFQCRDDIEDADDARDKYVARQLFRNLAADKRLVQPQTDGQPYTLFSEDFRPANVLVDKDDRVVGVIDWEFAYIAPRSFSEMPPYWLLLEKPEDFSPGPDAWLEQCEPYMQTFLRLLEEAEAKQASRQDESHKSHAKDNDGNGLSLSQRMRANWTSRRWMVEYVARHTCAFDYFWWKYIDESYFGENEDQDHKERLGLLTDVQREQMEPFVAKKLLMNEEKEILQCTDEEAQCRLLELLIR